MIYGTVHEIMASHVVAHAIIVWLASLNRGNAMLLETYVVCFFIFCLFVVIKSNLKPKTTEETKAKDEPSCAVDPELADFELSLKRDIETFLSGKPKSKRNAGKKGSKHVRKNGGLNK